MRRVQLALDCSALAGILAVSAVLIGAPARVLAQDDGDLVLMREPHSYVDVADAADDDDPFDLNLTVGFRNEYSYGNIQRESQTPVSGDPHRAAQNWVDIAHQTHSRNILDLGLQIGIFRDLMIYGAMPIILSDDRRLGQVAGSAVNPADHLRGPLVDADGDLVDDLNGLTADGQDPLFSVPFNSPTRSGLDYIAAGLAWSIFNQNRERELPTWVLMLEGRFNVGDPLVACNGTSGSPNCRNWSQAAGGGPWTPADGGGDAGETRGTNAFRVETRASWRAGYVEPFFGLLFQAEWAGSAERFYLPAGNLNGIVNERPPLLGQFTGGLAIIPWENRAGFQRFAIDLRMMGKYVSEGREYSPLFDALGTSQNRYLTNPNLEGTPGTGGLRTVPFFGLTDVAPHAELGAHLGVEMRAARFVRFQLMGDLWYVQPYIITYADACNPNFTAPTTDDPRRGTCRRGIINPNHRPVIDLPGQNFRADEQVRIQIQFNVTGMF